VSLAADPFALAADILDPQPTEFEHDWATWLRVMFPAYCTAPFADFHAEFWAWLWAIKRNVRPDPFVGIWFRGGAKSTSTEIGCIALGARNVRDYVVYVSETQDQADQHVANIGAMLETPAIEQHYPLMASRGVNKYGHSKGWRRNRVITASGFIVDALGLDTARRGFKVDEHRPGVIVLDDIDKKGESLAGVQKKVDTITASIMPMGTRDTAVIAIQNLIHENSIFSQLLDGRAEFMTNRIISGPVPAIRGMEYERQRRDDGKIGYTITAGTPTWEGFDLADCQSDLDLYGLTAFLSECQHDVEPRAGGMFSHLEYEHCAPDEVPWGLALRTVVWVDPAVTDTDDSDSHGIQADMLAIDGRIYRLRSWENRTTPVDALTRAIRWAVEFRAEHVGVETDQGGDTWLSVWREAVEKVREELSEERDSEGLAHLDALAFRADKAGSYGSKVHRASKMLAEYERSGRFVHVLGTHTVLERALRRFPKTKPFDLVDVAFWSWNALASSGLPLDAAAHSGRPRPSLGREPVVLPPDTDFHIEPASAPSRRKGRSVPRW
jgi:hypothetical protein